jgi:hypothetical protein
MTCMKILGLCSSWCLRLGSLSTADDLNEQWLVYETRA